MKCLVVFSLIFLTVTTGYIIQPYGENHNRIEDQNRYENFERFPSVSDEDDDEYIRNPFALTEEREEEDDDDDKEEEPLNLSSVVVVNGKAVDMSWDPDVDIEGVEKVLQKSYIRKWLLTFCKVHPKCDLTKLIAELIEVDRYELSRMPGGFAVVLAVLFFTTAVTHCEKDEEPIRIVSAVSNIVRVIDAWKVLSRPLPSTTKPKGDGPNEGPMMIDAPINKMNKRCKPGTLMDSNGSCRTVW